MMDGQNKFLADIEDNARHEMIRHYKEQGEKMEQRMQNPDQPADQEADGPGSQGMWRNLAELIDGITLDDYTTAATPTISPPPPRVVIKEEPH